MPPPYPLHGSGPLGCWRLPRPRWLQNRSKIDQQIQVREVKSGSGYLSQSDLRLHFGLGQAKQIDQIEIRWPNGTNQQLDRVPGNQILTVKQEKLSG